MARFLVTGANKGIGLATVKGLLDTNKQAFVFLGSRDVTRGQDAVKSIVEASPESYSGRVEALQIDVSDDGSVSRAVETVRARLAGGASTPAHLDALINNAGMVPSDSSSLEGFASCVDVNFHGVVRVTEAFLPLLEPSKGRVVFTSSSAGPTFVSKCSPERQALMTDPAVTHQQITGLADECLGIASGGGNLEEKFAAVGLSGVEGVMGVYGFTKVRFTAAAYMLVHRLELGLVEFPVRTRVWENPSSSNYHRRGRYIDDLDMSAAPSFPVQRERRRSCILGVAIVLLCLSCTAVVSTKTM